jgi:hypothetical protein
MTLSDLVAAIDSERQHGNLSLAKRIAQGDFDLVLAGLGRKDRQPALRDPRFCFAVARRECAALDTGSRMDEVFARAMMRKPEPIEWDETTTTASTVPEEAPVEEASTLTAH